MKPYRPWHRNVNEPDDEPLIVKVVAWIVLALIIWSLVLFTFMAIDKQAMIDDAYYKGQRDMRQAIYEANMDILRGHEQYIKQIDALIEKEYRSKRKEKK